MRPVLLSLVATGCASVNPPELPAAQIEVDNGTVTGPEFSMSFGRAPDLQMPDRFEVRQKQVLDRDADCPFERNVGFGLFPAGTISAGSELDSPSSELIILQDGPFVAQLQSSFSIDYACDDGTHTTTGAMAFTFFPNGRIVRQDLGVLPTGDVVASTAGCGCGSAIEFVFTSYWAFDSEGAQFQDASNVENGTAVNGRACTVYPAENLALGVAWSETRIRLGSSGSPAAHVLDFLPPNSTSLQPTPITATSAFMFADTCGEALAALEDPSLIVDEIRLPSTEADGIYRDFNPHDSDFDIRADGQPIPPFAISLDLDGHAVITPPPGDRSALVQREEGTRSLLYFPDGLGADETITIRLE